MIQYKLKINNIVGNQCNIDDAIHFSATKKVEERTWLIQRPDFCGHYSLYNTDNSENREKPSQTIFDLHNSGDTPYIFILY